MTVVPPRKPNEGNILIRELHSDPGIAMVRRQPEVADSQPGFESFFANKPVRWALPLG
jgi:hypothetical protein